MPDCSSIRRAVAPWACVVILALSSTSGCATIPERQYGIDSIDWVGVEQMSEEALEACLATRERDAVTLRLGFAAPTCGEPPFDDAPPAVSLWSFPWSIWPVYDPAIVGVDRERIERWYAARGFYDARVLQVDAFAGGEPVGQPKCQQDDCELRLVVQLEEGDPVLVAEVTLEGDEGLDPDLRETLRKRIRLAPDTRFDEATYAADKERLAQTLRNSSRALAKVEGDVLIDRAARTARVHFELDGGAPHVFGDVRVEGSEEIPRGLIVRAADIPAGKPYSDERVDDAQRAVFALGVFSSVTLERHHERPGIVDIVIVTRTGRLRHPSAGVGIMSGTLRRTTSDEVFSVPQWDVHLRLAYEDRNFLGGLRRLRIEERPRLVMLDDFPQMPGEGPTWGNVLSVIFEQPATFEARTVLFSDNEWDLGPDAFYGYFRHDVALKLGLRRSFFKQRLQAHVAVEHDFYRIVDDNAPDTVSNYRLPFLEQQVRLDLRDDSRRPRLGAYAAITVQEALRVAGYGSWNYVRLLPDVRGYVPLLWDLVLAARFSLGAVHIFESAPKLDPTSATLGPQAYRLRGGGANSNRGFFPGELGDGREGGIRRWEGSMELRLPLGSDVGVVAFGDVGDVARSSDFRFTHLNAAAGLGLRYYTLIGALRLDAAWRIPGLQRAGGGGPSVDLGVAPSAVHLTIGEAF